MTEICQKTLLSNEAILQHLLVIHCVSLEDLFEQLPIKRSDRTTIKESAVINSAAESTAVIRDKGSKQLYDKGNNFSSTYNITDANGEFKHEIEKKWDSEKDFYKICCYNEGHIEPLMFSSTLELEKHLKNIHKCFQCSFYTMMEADMSLHISKVHTEQTKCFVCKSTTKDLQIHLK